VSYTAYGGALPNDIYGGFVYGLTTQTFANTPQGRILVLGVPKAISSYGGPVYGADLRWATPLKGLLAGTSFENLDTSVTGTFPSSHNAPYYNNNLTDVDYAFYTQYILGNAQFDGEYRKEARNTVADSNTGAPAPIVYRDSRQGYVSMTYRISKWLQVGAYHSRFVLNWNQNHGDPRNHLFDQALTARVDLRRYLDFKVEGHFMDGAMVSNGLDRGFYLEQNPNGLKPNMKMLVIRLEYHL
jgi:hypothetical protein